MKRSIDLIKLFFSVSIHFLALSYSIVKTFFRRVALKILRKKTDVPYLQVFIDKKKKTRCNLSSLFDSIQKQLSCRIILSNLLKVQENYKHKDELLDSLPKLSSNTEMVAIPIAIKAFGFFRHFVTIIIDTKTQVLEFYDPIGFSINQYRNAILWGTKCEKSNSLSLNELIDCIKEKYGICAVEENTHMHQTDVNQCALFVYDWLHKRCVRRFSIKEAEKKPLTSNQAFCAL